MDEIYYIYHVHKQSQGFTGLLGYQTVSLSAYFSVFQRNVSAKSLSNIRNDPPTYTVSHPRRVNPQQHHCENFKSNENCPSNLTLASPCIIIQFKYINQVDATVPRVYYLMFKCGSTCFGRLHAHHQEVTTALAASAFTVGAWW